MMHRPCHKGSFSRSLGKDPGRAEGGSCRPDLGRRAPQNAAPTPAHTLAPAMNTIASEPGVHSIALTSWICAVM